MANFIKIQLNNNNKYLRTRIRALKKSLEKSGIKYDQIFQSIKNLASSRDTLDFILKKFIKELLKKKNKILINEKVLNVSK